MWFQYLFLSFSLICVFRWCPFLFQIDAFVFSFHSTNATFAWGSVRTTYTFVQIVQNNLFIFFLSLSYVCEYRQLRLWFQGAFFITFGKDAETTTEITGKALFARFSLIAAQYAYFSVCVNGIATVEITCSF